MLQSMRTMAKWIWLVVAVTFVGGFLLVDSSGLLGRTTITPTTAVAVVNGYDILYVDFMNRVQGQVQEEQQSLQQRGINTSLSEDDNRRIENDVFEQMVMERLLQEEYRRRGIVVTDDEIRLYAREAPPDWIVNQPDFQTNRQFDIEKYRRYLSSSVARQQGLLAMLEQHYRSEIPRRKLFDQLAASVYVTDSELWRAWRDQNDSVVATFVAFRPPVGTAGTATIPDSDLRSYFDRHKEQFKRPGRAVLSVVHIPRVVTAADTAAARARAAALRAEIVGGAKFEDVANRASSDSTTNGGDLGRGGRNRFVADFEKAAYALRVNEVSQPVQTPFGFHLIRVDEKKGDTLALRHILVPIEPSDSANSALDRKADSLDALTGSSEDPAKFDAAAKTLGLTPMRVIATENQPADANGRMIPSVSAWAFGGAQAGESSDLYDDENGYYIARLDTLQQGSLDDPDFNAVKEEVRLRVRTERALDSLTKVAEQFVAGINAASFATAAAAKGLTAETTPPFTRATFVPGLGQINAAIGTAFGLPAGMISQPVRTDDAVFVIRVDRRVNADSVAWLGQKSVQRQQRVQAIQQQQIQTFLQGIRSSAKVEDRRREINAAVRRQAL